MLFADEYECFLICKHAPFERSDDFPRSSVYSTTALTFTHGRTSESRPPRAYDSIIDFRVLSTIPRGMDKRYQETNEKRSMILTGNKST